MEDPRLGWNRSCSHQPTPEPQQRWARPGIKPANSWILVRFVNHWATTGTPAYLIFNSEGLEAFPLVSEISWGCLLSLLYSTLYFIEVLISKIRERNEWQKKCKETYKTHLFIMRIGIYKIRKNQHNFLELREFIKL